MITVRLYKYGIDITNATLQTYAYELGVEKAVSEMTQAEKQQLRIIAILDQSRVAWGDQANTINSLANQMRILENNTEEISLVFGQLFVPLMEQALPIVNGLTGAIKNLMTNIAGILGIKINVSSAGQGVASDIEQEMLDAEDATGNASDALKEYKNQMMGFDEAQKLNDTEANATLNTNLGDTIDLEEEILKATDEYEKFWEQAYQSMENKAEKWTKYFSGFFGTVEDIFKDIQLGDYLSLGIDISQTAEDFTKTLSNMIKKISWDDLGENVGKFLTGSISKSFSMMGSITGLAVEVGKGIASFLGKAIQNINFLQIAGGLIYGLGSSIIEITKGGFDIFNSFLGLTNGSEFFEIDASISTNLKEAKEDYDLIMESIREQNKNLVLGSSVKYSYLDDLLSKFEELASKGNLTNIEMDEFNKYRQALIDSDTKIRDILNDENKTYQEQADEIRDVIKQLKNKQIQESASNALTELYEEQLKKAQQIADFQKNDLAQSNQKVLDTEKKIAELENSLAQKREEYQKAWEEGNSEAVLHTEAVIGKFEGQLALLTAELEKNKNELKTNKEVLSVYKTEYDALNQQIELYVDVAAGVKTADDIIRESNLQAGSSFGNLATDAKTASSKMQGAFALADWTDIGTNMAKSLINGFDANFTPPETKWQERLQNSLFGKDGKLEFEFSFDTGTVEGFENFKNKWAIKAYAAGGFPEDGLFFANRGELIGEFPNGKTAVANSYQIQEGIEEASYRGMARALTQYQGNGGNVTIVLQGDADGLFKVVQNKANNYAIQTGQSPFLI